MFSNKDSNWEKTKELNDAGPKTKLEVKREMEEKMKAEQAQRDNDRRDNYNNRGDNRDRGDNRNQKKGGKYQEKNTAMKYQKKEPGSPTKKGKGGNKEEKLEIKIVEIGDDEMGEALKANFEAYATKQSADNQNEEEKEQKDDDFDVFQDLK